MTKRILFWSERFWPTIGGVGLSAGKLLPELRDRGWEIVVLTLKENADLPEEDEFEGIRVCRWPLWTALKSGDVFQLLECRQRIAGLKRDFSPDLIHINFVGSSVLFHQQTLNVHPAPVLVSLDSAFLEQGAGPDSLAGRVVDSADWVTCVSSFSLARMRELLPGIASRSSVIYKGAKLPTIDPDPLPTATPRLLCLGRLVRTKGFDLALSAFAEVVARFPDARLQIAGDGPERPELEHQITELGLESAVDLLGWVEPNDIAQLMNQSTLVVISSRNEGLPNVAKEAGLMCRPVVATNVDGLPEIILDGETGLLVESESASSLAGAVTFLLEHPEEAEAMGRKARERVADVFNFEKYVDAYDSLYDHLIATARK